MDLWVDRLVQEYSEGKSTLERYRKSLDKKKIREMEESKVVGGMISDMQYALQWMRRGRRPGNRRGIERRSVYQRTTLLDIELFPAISLETQERPLTDIEKQKLVEVLITFSERERQCYLLHMAQGMSYAEIAKELNISRSSVQKFVERAKKKIAPAS